MPRPMKDSGVEWLGDIPAHWNVIRIKYLCNNEKDSFQDGDWIESPFVTEEGIRYLTTGNVGDGIFKRQGNGHISEDTFVELNCKYAYPNDLVISRLNAPYGRACILPSDEDKYVLAVDIVILRTDHDKRYLCYLMQCQGYQNTVQDAAKGTTMKRISRTNLGNIYLPIAPLEEQQRIATFLDGKCARIDSVIEKTRASIEEYKKLKQSLITRAVTKGIRPARPMKDSGVEWIGDIPADWSTCRLRFLCDILTGNQDTQDNDPNGEYPFYVRSPIVERSNKYTFEGDAILMAGDGAGAGKVFHYVSGKYGCHQRVYSLQNIKGIVRRFLFYYLQNRFYVSIETANSKSTVDSVRLNMLKDFPILMPPLEEQKEIAQYLDEKTAATDLVVGKKNQLVTELERLKKSLIFEYVTGKKAVAI